MSKNPSKTTHTLKVGNSYLFTPTGSNLKLDVTLTRIEMTHKSEVDYCLVVEKKTGIMYVCCQGQLSVEKVRSLVPPPPPPPTSRLTANLVKVSGLEEKPPHLIIDAKAGTGKTTTLLGGLNELKGIKNTIEPMPQQRVIWDAICQSSKDSSVCMVAFNKSIAQVLQKRVPPGCEALTLHSLGYRAIQKSMGRKEIAQGYVADLIALVLGQEMSQIKKDAVDFVILKAVEQLVGLCKQTLVVDLAETAEEGIEDIRALIDHYEVEVPDNREGIVIEVTLQVIEMCRQDRPEIDFNDMVWYPVALGLIPSKYDLLFVDEAQDLNRCQQELTKLCGKRLIYCGDPYQAIYGFAGADSRSMARLKEEMIAGGESVVSLPLSVTRRCGRRIVEEAKAKGHVPNFQAHESNPDGVISYARFPSEDYFGVLYRERVQVGDMVLCRNNAPLVSECLAFISGGKRAIIQGRDIGKGLVKLIDSLKAYDVIDLVAKVASWYRDQCDKENQKKAPSSRKLQSYEDRRMCVEAFAQKANNVSEVVSKIETMFSDEIDPSMCIRLSSIHKAKGLESKRVFFLRPKIAPCPHPKAEGWQYEQECNLCYVAVTRAIEELVYVH